MSSGPQEGAPGGDSGEHVGSVSEEAARLFGALSGWAQEHTPAGEGPEECSWCPLCRTAHAIRATSPEVREHLANAASSLMQAAAGLLAASAAASGPGDRERPRPGVEHIDLDDGGWPPEEER